MNRDVALALLLLFTGSSLCAQSAKPTAHAEAEYYVNAYAQHYKVPIPLVRAIVQRESNWRICAVSPKGAAGLMQLMPVTAQRLGVRDRCNVDQNVSGGVRYLAWLMRLFHGDLRLVAAAYFAGEDIVMRRGLQYRNPEVVTYVTKIRATYLRTLGVQSTVQEFTWERDVR